MALLQSELPPGSLLELGDALLDLYPTDLPMENRELIRLLVHLQVMGAAEKEVEASAPTSNSWPSTSTNSSRATNNSNS